MALITSPAARRFSNENCRVIANNLMKLYRTAKQFELNVVDFEALTNGNDNGDIIDDNAEIAGRPIVTKLNVAELKFVLGQFTAAMQTDDRLALTNKWTHDTTPLF